jgi:L-arabonate dehydrase
MVRENLTIDKILTRDAFLNAIRTLAAVGGSTNAVVHLLATAGRLGVKLTLEVEECAASPQHDLLNLFSFCLFVCVVRILTSMAATFR